MIHQLRNSTDGAEACYKTTLEITENGSSLTFRFVAVNSKYNCPYRTYNAPHYKGDVCEVFIGTAPDKKVYYEVEITPMNDLFLAKITYQGKDENGSPILHTDYVEESFVKSNAALTDNGYIAEISFDKNNVITGDGDLFFNAYRIETDGEAPEKHLFALNPTMQGRFHVPERYVTLKDYL